MPNLFVHCRGEVSLEKMFFCGFVFGPRLAKDCTKRTCGTRGAGLRGAKLRPAAVPFGTANSKFKIQNSELWDRIYSLRPLIAARLILCKEPAAERWACDVKEQPSARGRLRAAAPVRAQTQDSKNRIKRSCRCAWTYIPFRVAACGAHADSGTNCGPPLPGGCGPPTS